MDAIHKIIEEINNQAKDNRDRFEAEEIAAIDSWFLAEEQAATKTHRQQQDKQLKDLQQKYKQLRSRQQMDVRQESLVEKQRYLDRLFEEAYTKMATWDKEEIQGFAEVNLKRLPIAELGVLLPSGPNATMALDASFVAEVQKELAYQLTLGEPLTAGGEGFVVDVAGVQYNFLYRDLLNEQRSLTGNEMSQKLFG
ncbi:hypothetical protein [Enterococcus diestrammenae]|uniref:hypothetical protein n=1 Tax=Enterococcus diestrammenae TaxID=1155073 RepID=UPI00195EBD18